MPDPLCVCRPYQHFDEVDDALSVETLHSTHAIHQGAKTARLDVFLEVAGPQGLTDITSSHRILFMKAYNPIASNLQVSCACQASLSAQVCHDLPQMMHAACI